MMEENELYTKLHREAERYASGFLQDMKRRKMFPEEFEKKPDPDALIMQVERIDGPDADLMTGVFYASLFKLLCREIETLRSEIIKLRLDAVK